MSVKDFQYFFAGFTPFTDKLLLITYENFLMEFDLKTSALRFAHGMNSEVCRELAPDHVERLLRIGQNLMAVSMRGNKAYLYAAESDRWHGLEIDCHQKDWGNYLGIFSQKEYVYLVPGYRKYIVKIDTVTKDISQIGRSVMSQINAENTVACFKEDFIYFFDGEENAVFIYNIFTEECRCVKVDGILGRIIAVQYYENSFFLLSESGRVMTWNEQKTLEILIKPINETRPHAFGQLAVTDKNIWLLPALGEDIYVYDYQNKELTRYEDYPEKMAYLDFENYYKFAAGVRYEDKIYFGMHSANHLLCVDLNTGEGKWFYPKLPTEEQTYAFRRCHGLSREVSEKEMPLTMFLQEISQAEEGEMEYQWQKKMIGTIIWEKLGEKNDR